MDDYKETIRFTREYNLQLGRISQVDMREPNTADIRRAVDASQKYTSLDMKDIIKEQYLMMHLTELTQDDLDKLAACDYERLQIGLLILRADPDNRAKLRRDYALDKPAGEDAPSDCDPATSEGTATESPPDAATPISALP